VKNVKNGGAIMTCGLQGQKPGFRPSAKERLYRRRGCEPYQLDGQKGKTDHQKGKGKEPGKRRERKNGGIGDNLTTAFTRDQVAAEREQDERRRALRSESVSFLSRGREKGEASGESEGRYIRENGNAETSKRRQEEKNLRVKTRLDKSQVALPVGGTSVTRKIRKKNEWGGIQNATIQKWERMYLSRLLESILPGRESKLGYQGQEFRIGGREG